jgi:uncharacterized protein (TIGR02246 family)
MDDETAIRALVQIWMDASRAGDTATLLSLMTDDVVFMVPGQEPFGREAFEQAMDMPDRPRIDGKSEIVELRILGDWAYIRNHIDLTVTPASGAAMRRNGYSLTLLRKEADGRWRLFRDANLLAPQS